MVAHATTGADRANGKFARLVLIDQTACGHIARLHVYPPPGMAPKRTLPNFSTLHRNPAPSMQGFFWPKRLVQFSENLDERRKLALTNFNKAW
jgi:hypothetical protein